MGLRQALLLLLTAMAIAAAPGNQAKPVYQWKDGQGQVQITHTPPPPGVEVLSAPASSLSMEARGGRLVVRQSAGSVKQRRPADLNPAQRAAWEELGKHLSQARGRGDTSFLEMMASGLLHGSLWGDGLGWVTLIPILTVALMVLMGWWLSFGLASTLRVPVVAGFTLVGLFAAQVLVAHFLYRPQSHRVRLNISLFTEHYLGGEKPLSQAQRDRLNQCYAALEDASGPFNLPWRFYGEVDHLEKTLKQVVTSP